MSTDSVMINDLKDYFEENMLQYNFEVSML